MSCTSPGQGVTARLHLPRGSRVSCCMQGLTAAPTAVVRASECTCGKPRRKRITCRRSENLGLRKGLLVGARRMHVGRSTRGCEHPPLLLAHCLSRRLHIEGRMHPSSHCRSLTCCERVHMRSPFAIADRACLPHEVALLGLFSISRPVGCSLCG